MSEEAFLQVEQLELVLPDGRCLFAGLSCAIGREKVGLVGPNGSGKSTLLKLLLGQLAPTGGTVQRRGTLGYLPQLPSFPQGSSVADGLHIRTKLHALQRIEAGSCEPDDFAALADDWLVAERAQQTLVQLRLGHLRLTTPLVALSGGELTRVVLGQLLLEQPDLLLLDEPTNNLDAMSRDVLYNALSEWPGAVLLVTHDRELLRRVDRILRLSPHGLRSYGGNYDAYAMAVATEEAAAQQRLDHATGELKKVKRQVQVTREKHQRREAQGNRYRKSGSQSKLFLNAQKERSTRSQGSLGTQAERLVESATKTLTESRNAVELRPRMNLSLEATRVASNRTVLALEDVAFSPPGRGPVLNGMQLQVIGPERLAVEGPNGSGKTTLLRLIRGDLKPTRGVVRLGVQHCAYLDQRTSGLRDGHTVLENFCYFNPTVSESEGRERLAAFLFVRDAVFRPAGALSGGERIRLALACTLLSQVPPQLVLLDEPTNHLDFEAIASMEQAFREYQGALIVVSHDEDFLANLGCERRVVLSSGVEF